MQPNNTNNNEAGTIPPEEEICAALGDQSMDTPKRSLLKRKSMEPSCKKKFMRNFIRHEAQVDEFLLEVMTESSRERDSEGDKNLLNDYEDDDEMYEMQEHNICNMAVSDPRNIRDKGYEGTKKDIDMWTDIDLDDEQKSDKPETSNCISTVLSQSARSSVNFLRKSLNYLLMQKDNHENFKDQANKTQWRKTPYVECHESEMDPILEKRLISLKWLTMTLNVMKLKKYYYY